METINHGFLPLPEKYLQEMRKRMLSVYCLHTPLDINEDISTSLSIAKALEMINIKRFHENSVGYSGIIGDIAEEIDFEEYIINLKSLLFRRFIILKKRFTHANKISKFCFSKRSWV